MCSTDTGASETCDLSFAEGVAVECVEGVCVQFSNTVCPPELNSR